MADLSAPEDQLNFWLLAPLFAVWVVAVNFLHRYRIWILFYTLGTVGFVYFVVVVGGALQLDVRLAQSVAWSVHTLSSTAAIPTRIFEAAPGVLLVLVVAQEVGWTALHVGVESSGMLEISVLVALLLFYPSWPLRRRVGAALLGSAAMWIANILRMLLIVGMLNRLGKEALVLAHTYVGKALFFAMAIAVFWFLITYPTIHSLRRATN